EEALPLASERVRGTLLLNLPGLLAFQGRLTRSIAALEEALTLDMPLHNRAIVLGNLGVAHHTLGALERAEEALARAAEAPRAAGEAYGPLWTAQQLATVDFLAGRTDAAVARIGQVLDRARAAGQSARVYEALICVARFGVHRGAVSE